MNTITVKGIGGEASSSIGVMASGTVTVRSGELIGTSIST